MLFARQFLPGMDLEVIVRAAARWHLAQIIVSAPTYEIASMLMKQLGTPLIWRYMLIRNLALMLIRNLALMEGKKACKLRLQRYGRDDSEKIRLDL